MHKHIFISDIALGNSVSDLFLLTGAMQGQSRNGPYWALEFRDTTGLMKGKMWSPQSLKYPELPSGEIMLVTAKVTSYRGILELAVSDLEPLTDEQKNTLELGDFVTASPFPPDVMLAELKQLCHESFTHEPWRMFIDSLLDDEEISTKLMLAPAAKSMHHAYAGGLLEHTLSVCRLCLLLAGHYPTLDRQTLLAGALCHDLGKIWELTSGMTVEYTASGHLLGHIILLLDKIRPFLDSSGLEPELVQHLQHLIASHHGTLEYGSPKLPATAEALVLHYADNIDAKMQQTDNALALIGEGEWSPRVFGLDRMLYRSKQTPLCEPEKMESLLTSESLAPDESTLSSELVPDVAAVEPAAGVPKLPSLSPVEESSSAMPLYSKRAEVVPPKRAEVVPPEAGVSSTGDSEGLLAGSLSAKRGESRKPDVLDMPNDGSAVLSSAVSKPEGESGAESRSEAWDEEPGDETTFSIVDASAPGAEHLLAMALASGTTVAAMLAESLLVEENEIPTTAPPEVVPETEKLVALEEKNSSVHSVNTAVALDVQFPVTMVQEADQGAEDLCLTSEGATKKVVASVASPQKDPQPLSLIEQCLLLSKE